MLRPVRKFADQQHWKVSVVHVHGHAAEAIAALAEEMQPDLIVMGTHGHSALGNVVLGSVANRCAGPLQGAGAADPLSPLPADGTAVCWRCGV